MNVVFLKELALGPTGKLICAKRDREGRIVLYLDAIALEYPDPQQGINTYLRCFREFNEDEHPRDEDGKWTDGGGSNGGDESTGTVGRYSDQGPLKAQSTTVVEEETGRKIEVLINQTSGDLERFAREHDEVHLIGDYLGAEKYGNQPITGVVRVMLDTGSANLYAWSPEVVHERMEDALSMEPVGDENRDVWFLVGGKLQSDAEEHIQFQSQVDNDIDPKTPAALKERQDAARRRVNNWIEQGRTNHKLADKKKVWSKEFNEDEHPRDEDGKFTDSGGSDGGGDSETSGGGGTGEHPGKGYSAAAYVKNGVIHTSSVYDAQRALYENRKVELNQPRTLSVLIGRLGAEAKRMIAQGKSAPSFNLCNVTVSGTNLFCADTKGIPRVEMPQLDKQQTKDFRKYLEDQGYKVSKEKQFASHLRATQNEINGAKVASTAVKIEAQGGRPKSIIISKDDYILDGHHAWAAKLGLDAADNKLENDTKMHVHRVDISITKLLAEAEKFTGGKGHKPANEAKEFNEDEHPRDEDGKWTDAGGGDGGGESTGGGGTGTTEYPSGWLTERPSATEHPGVSSDLDLRPQRPMPAQSGAVTVGGISSPSASAYRDVPITINPSVSVTKKIIREAGEDGARALQDRAGNVVVWQSSGALHADMMDALAPMETMWASDIWTIEDGKIKSVMGNGTAMAASWLERGQTNAKNAEAASVGFVSPNVKTDLDFGGAIVELKSAQHAALMSASADVDRSLGVKAKETSIIGAWADGAENSIMATAGSDWDHVALATVMKGHLADQKSVLVFQQGRGDAALSHFRATGKLEEIHRNLLEDGLAFHTLVPEKDGAVVYVADLDGSLADAIEKGAARYDARLTTQFGRGEFIGDTRADKDKGDDREQRDYARKIYEKNIAESKVEGSRAVWASVRDRWGQTAKVKFFQREVDYIQDPETGRFEGSHGHSGSDVGEGGGTGGGGGSPTAVVSSARDGVAHGSKLAKEKGIKPLTGSDGHPNLISTRLASAKGIDQTIFRQPSMAAMKENTANFDHDMALFKNTAAYPNLRSSETKGSSEQIARAVIDHSKENLKFLYDNAPKETKEHGKFWYDGARVLVNEHVDKYKLNDASVAGVYAALSPQKLWDMNVYLGDRVIEIHQTQQNTPWSKKMDATAAAIWKTDKNKKILALVQGKKLSELKTPAEKAIWIRTYDEAHSDRHFKTISPLGVRGDYMKNKDGKLSRAAWQSLPSITNAIRSLEANGDQAIISKAMGTQHKVRSFYNNILDPYSKNGDVTIDTHAVGAALLRPLTGGDAAVLHSMGLGPDKDKQPPNWEAASGSVKTGVQGLYGIYATAYRELAHELKIGPRQLQSITWEAKRKLFDRGLKDTEAASIESAWQDYHTGKASLKDTQNKVVEIAGGFVAGH